MSEDGCHISGRFDLGICLVHVQSGVALGHLTNNRVKL